MPPTAPDCRRRGQHHDKALLRPAYSGDKILCRYAPQKHLRCRVCPRFTRQVEDEAPPGNHVTGKHDNRDVRTPHLFRKSGQSGANDGTSLIVRFDHFKPARAQSMCDPSDGLRRQGRSLEILVFAGGYNERDALLCPGPAHRASNDLRQKQRQREKKEYLGAPQPSGGTVGANQTVAISAIISGQHVYGNPRDLRPAIILVRLCMHDIALRQFGCPCKVQ